MATSRRTTSPTCTVYAGVPHKTQARIRSLIDTMYAAQPNGMQGNEDVGQMSAWYLMSALGFYSVDPVSGIYVLGSPVVNSARVALGDGKTLTIKVDRKHPADAYVREFYLNGKKAGHGVVPARRHRRWRHAALRHGQHSERTTGCGRKADSAVTADLNERAGVVSDG